MSGIAKEVKFGGRTIPASTEYCKPSWNDNDKMPVETLKARAQSREQIFQFRGIETRLLEIF